MSPLLSIRASVTYRGAFQAVLRDIALDIAPGEVVGLLGRSGSGKSTLALAVLGLLRRRQATATGTITFRGENLLELSESRLRRIRGREIALVLQAAASALNPGLTLEAHFREAWLAHGSGPWEAQKQRVYQRLNSLELDGSAAFLRRYPGEISVGQAQRVLIALANLHDPDLLIMDEPTSALDSLARAEVLALVRRLSQDRDVAMLYISHDLAAVSAVCHRIAILHDGALVETGSPAQIFSAPQHDVTKALAAASRELVECSA